MALTLTLMSGAEFLGAYVGLSAIVTLLGWAWGRMVDTSLTGRMPRVDGPLEPQDMAFMSDGAEGVARLTLHDMVARGYLETRAEESVFAREVLVAPAKQRPALGYLTPLEREVVQAVEGPVSVEDLMRRGLVERVQPYAQPVEERLVRAGLAFGEEARALRRNVWLVGVAALLMVAAARFVATLADHAPETSWLAVLGITATVCVALGWAVAGRRQTRLGERWMEAVRAELVTMRAMRDHRAALTDRNRLLLLAVFGPPRQAIKIAQR